MNILKNSSLIKALHLGPCGRPHIHRIVPFIYRNYTQFCFTDGLNTSTIDSHLSINLESVGQANKSLIKPKWQPELVWFPSKCQGGGEPNRKVEQPAARRQRYLLIPGSLVLLSILKDGCDCRSMNLQFKSELN